MSQKLRNIVYSILRKSEKYTKTDMVYLATGGFWLSLGQIISTLSVFLLSIAYANFLPKEVYGQFKYILAIFDVLLISNLEGMSTALARSTALGFQGSFFAALKTKLKWSFFGSIVSLALSIYYFFDGQAGLAASFLITAAFVLIVENFKIYQPFLQGIQRFDLATKYNSLINVFSAIAVVATIYLSQNLQLLLFVLFASQFLPRLYFFFRVKKTYIKNNNVEPDTLSYGKKLSLINVINTIANEADKILIYNLLGPVNLAIYTFAYAPTEHIKSLLKNIQSLALPRFALRTKEEIQQTILKKSLKLSALALVVALAYIAAAPFIFKLVFPQYMESVIYTQILALSLVTVPIWIYRSAFMAQKLTKQLYQLDLSNSIIQLILTAVMIYQFGLWGAVISRIAYRFINLALSITILRRA